MLLINYSDFIVMAMCWLCVDYVDWIDQTSLQMVGLDGPLLMYLIGLMNKYFRIHHIHVCL